MSLGSTVTPRHGLAVTAVLGLLLIGEPTTLLAEERIYEFAASAAGDRSAIWRVDRLSGEVGLCLFDKGRRDPVGRMVCLERGDGAGVQNEPGPYGLVATAGKDEMRIFRMNHRTGIVSLCYEIDDRKGQRIVCTEPNR